MKDKKVFYIITVLVISFTLLILIYNIVMSNYKINQGKFRVQDVVLANTLEIISNSDKYNTLAFSANLKNKFVLLIKPQEEVKISEIYIKNIKPKDIYFSDRKSKDVLAKNIKKLNVDYLIQEDGQVLIELEFVKKQIIQNYVLNNSQDMLPHDGRAISLVGLKINDIDFYLEFELYILENSGKLNKLKVKIKTPNDELLTKGEYINKLNLTDFVFRVK